MKKVFLFFGVPFIFLNIVSAQTIDDFNYAGNLNANGWSTHSGIGSNVIETTAGLTYSGYINSGIGNAALLKNLSGEDVNYTAGIGPYNSNGATIYFSFMVNVTESSNTKSGDYFIHMGKRTSATSFSSFSARVFERVVGGSVNFGISNASVASYGSTNFSKNTTYLIVVKYTINTSGNDRADLWVFSSGVVNSEAAAGSPELSSTTTAGQDVIDAVALRQGSPSSSVQTVVDGIRVADSWFVLLTSPPVATIATNVSATSFDANWNAVSGASGYKLDVATDAAFTNMVAGYNNLDVGNVITKSVTGLTASVKYYYRVRAYNSINESGLNSNVKTNVEIALTGIEDAVLAYAEGDPTTQITATATVTTNLTNLDGAAIQITGNYQNGEDILSFTDANGITASWNAATGIMTLTGTTTVVNYQAALRNVAYQNTSQNPGTSKRIISFTVTGLLFNSNTITRDISITAINNAPVLAGIEISNLNYSEGEGTKPITSSLTVNDVDNTTLQSAVVQITDGYVNGEDILLFTDRSGITGTWMAATGTLNLNGSATAVNYQIVLQSIRYQNVSQNPNTSARTVGFTVNDGALNSNTVSRIINITAVNNPPTLSSIETFPFSYPGGATAVAITQTIVLNDPDNLNMVNAEVKIAGHYQNGNDILGFTNPGPGGITGTWNASTGTITLTGVATIANYQTALRSVSYQHIDEIIPDKYMRTITFTVNDGAVDGNIVSRDVYLGNMPPVLAGIETYPLEYKQGDDPKTITNRITITDDGIPALQYAMVRFSNNYNKGEDVLSFNNQNGIVGTWYPLQGALVLNLSSSLENYEAALKSVTYHNTSNTPNKLPRTLNIIVGDVYFKSNEVTRAINVTPIYTVTLINEPNNGGVTTGAGTFDPGTSVTVTATPNTGYNFVNWTEGETEVSTNASYTFTINSHRTLTANFALIQFTVTTSSAPFNGGTVSGSGIYNYGTSVTMVAVPNDGYSFVNWTSGGTIVSTAQDYTFTINSNRNLVANFMLLPVLTVTPDFISVGSVAGSALFSVSNSGGGTMDWTAVSNVFWIKIKSGASGTNNGTINVSYDNNNSATRIGTITITSARVKGSPKTVEIKQGEPITFVENLNLGIPDDFRLEQNYPNPFNPSTKIRYGLPKESNVVLTIYNILGEEIARLVDDVHSAGYYEATFDATNLSSGVYIYRISAGNFTQIRKMLLIR